MYIFKFNLKFGSSITETFETTNDGMKRYDELLREGLEITSFEYDVNFSGNKALDDENLAKGMTEFDMGSWGPSEEEVRLAGMFGIELKKTTYH